MRSGLTLGDHKRHITGCGLLTCHLWGWHVTRRLQPPTTSAWAAKPGAALHGEAILKTSMPAAQRHQRG